MSEMVAERPHRRIVVALDASSYSLAALRTAAELAALLDIELEGLFVEDINLLHLCGFPFNQEIGSYTGAPRRLDNSAIERELRAIAATIHNAINKADFNPPVRWSFQVRRGPVVKELLDAAQNADLLSLGRSGQRKRSSLGSTARAIVEKSRRPLLLMGAEGGLVYPLIAVYTGSAAAQRALEWLATLSRQSRRLARVLLVARPGDPQSIGELEKEARAVLGNLPVEFIPVRYGNVLMTLAAHNHGTLVLPGEQASLVAEHTGPTLIVP